MRRSCFLLLVLSLVSMTGSCSKTDSKAGSSAPAVSTAELNSPAPDFTLKDLTGRNISLSEYRGKVVLLEFWATWCAPCKAAVPALVELAKKYEQKGLIVVGLSMDTDSDAAEKVRQFSITSKINYPVLLANEETSRLYNVISIPTSFLIGRDGRIVDIYRGYSEKMDSIISLQLEKLL